MKEVQDKIDETQKAKVTSELDVLKKAMEADDTDEMKKGIEAVTTVFHEISQKMYENVSQQGETAEGTGNEGPSDDNVVDAEFEEVEDEEK